LSSSGVIWEISLARFSVFYDNLLSINSTLYSGANFPKILLFTLLYLLISYNPINWLFEIKHICGFLDNVFNESVPISNSSSNDIEFNVYLPVGDSITSNPRLPNFVV